MITITRDEFEKKDVKIDIESIPLYGLERAAGVPDELIEHDATVKFRMKDDDGEVMCRGILDDDPDCENQSAALRWGEANYGCTTIEVQRDGHWRQEIG